MAEPLKRTYVRRPKPEVIEEQEELVGSNVSGRVVVRGRNGEQLTRTRSNNADFYEVPPEIIPKGWEYQWNRVSILGKPDLDASVKMYAQGWRPVEAGRHPGRWLPVSTNPKADIVVEGLRLEERPVELCEEARAEGRAASLQLVEDQKDELGLRRKLPAGFTRDNSELRRVERARTRRTIEAAPDVPRPYVQVDTDQS